MKEYTIRISENEGSYLAIFILNEKEKELCRKFCPPASDAKLEVHAWVEGIVNTLTVLGHTFDIDDQTI